MKTPTKMSFPPRKIVPKKVRFEIYKKAISVIQSEEQYAAMTGFGLCILLPCILWGLECYLDDAPNGKGWLYEDTTIMFPELTHEHINSIYGALKRNKNAIRIEILKSFIE